MNFYNAKDFVSPLMQQFSDEKITHILKTLGLGYLNYSDYTLIITIITLGLFLGILKIGHIFKANIYLISITTIGGFIVLKVIQGIYFKTADNSFIIQIIQFLSILLIAYFFIAQKEAETEEIRFEYPTLLMIAILGILVSLEHTEGLIIFLGIEIQAFTFYTLVALKEKEIFSAEGALKYFLIGAIASGLFILGLGLVYSIFAKTDFSQIVEIILNDNNKIIKLGGLMISIGLLFKIGAAPFHLWLPDAYQGAPFYVLIFLLTFPKITLFYLIFTINNIFENVWLMFFVLLASSIIGSIQAVNQTKIKRFIAYSVIFNNAYFISITFIAGLGAYLTLIQAISLYLMLTWTTTLCFFNLKSMSSETRLLSLRDLIGLKKSNIFIALILMLGFFSSAGIPPFIGFFQKYLLLLALSEKAQHFILVILIMSAILPAYYYIRISKIIFFLTASKYILLENINLINSNLISFLGICLIAIFY